MHAGVIRAKNDYMPNDTNTKRYFLLLILTDGLLGWHKNKNSVNEKKSILNENIIK